MRILSPVIVNLHSPREKVWGVLLALNESGVTVKGIDLNSFDDWTRQVARGEETIGLSTVFFPMYRVERIHLDENVGGLISYTETFAARVGRELRDYLKLPQPLGAAPLQFRQPAQSQGQSQSGRPAPRKKPGR